MTGLTTILVFLFGIIFVAFVGFDYLADGFIEIKKGHVTNSPKVCGDKLCSESQTEATETKNPNEKNSSSPLSQYKLGIPLDKIRCKINFIFILKSTNFYPACVKPSTAEKLVSQGWATSNEQQIQILQDLQPKKPTTKIKEFNETTITNTQTSEVKVTITPDFINGQRYLNFEGYGWLGYHNVEISISQGNFTQAKFLTETTDRGKLHVPWPIPESVGGGIYTITLSDSKNFYTIDIPISSEQ